METWESPMATGISEITGRTTVIRHATEADMFFIGEMIKKYHLDPDDLHFDQFVVATDNDNIIGIGRIRKTGEIYTIGCIAVIEEKRESGVGSLIVSHLLETAPVDIVYVLTDMTDYFKRLGFSEMKEGSKELSDYLDSQCVITDKKKASLLVYEKRDR